MKYRKMFLCIVIAASVFFAPVIALANDFKIIANANVNADTISAAELKRVFLEEDILLSDGTHVEPVLEMDGPVHQSFLRAYLGIDDSDLQMYYRTLVFTGKGFMPKELASDAEVVAYIAGTRGAIGYVSSAAEAESVKTLVVGPPRGAARRLILRIQPNYPETLKRLNIGGTVRLRISISARGYVDDVELLGGNPILAASATMAVRKWVYAAARSRTVQEVTLSFGTSNVDSH
jgi:TonB family protein